MTDDSPILPRASIAGTETRLVPLEDDFEERVANNLPAASTLPCHGRVDHKPSSCEIASGGYVRELRCGPNLIGYTIQRKSVLS